jgi:hypothetical protein
MLCAPELLYASEDSLLQQEAHHRACVFLQAVCEGMQGPTYAPLTYVAWTIYVVLYGLNYATACACLYSTSMLASMIHLWATIRGISNEPVPVTNSPPPG